MEINNTSKVTAMLPFNKRLNDIYCYESCRVPTKLLPLPPSWPSPPRCRSASAAAVTFVSIVIVVAVIVAVAVSVPVAVAAFS